MDAKTYISNIVNETINQIKEDKFRESIRPMIAEAVMEEHGGKIKVGALVQKLMDNPEFKQKAIDYLNNDADFNGWSADGSKRRTVTQRLKDKKIDYAPIAYELWPDMTEDAARSWFSKKVDGRDGESFTDQEISKIYNLLNNVMTE